MKKVILGALLFTGFAMNANLIKRPGTFQGTISGGSISGKCVTSSSTCYTYDTVSHDLTIHITMKVLHGATLPVEDADGNFTATYVE